jgi:hypothetical protein
MDGNGGTMRERKIFQGKVESKERPITWKGRKSKSI